MRIAVSVVSPTVDEMKKDMDLAVAQGTDILEIRFDFLNRPEQTAGKLQELIKHTVKPKIYTNRSISQAGSDSRFGFKGSEEERLELLQAAIASKVSYFDLEFGHNFNINPDRSAYILSYHDFERTPAYDTLKRVYHSLLADSMGNKPDILKIATKARYSSDCAKIFNLLSNLRKFSDEVRFDTIALCMGEKGIPTRILGPDMGSYLTFACLEGKPSASGQITIKELKEARRIMHLD